jgi:simple sugar transport system permease protein
MTALASAGVVRGARWATWLAPARRPGLWVPVSAVLLALVVGLVLIAAAGVSLREAIAAFADGAWGSPYSIGASLNRAVALALVGLGFIVAHRANLTNVGGEGQIALGGIASTTLCLYGGAASLPGPFAWIVPLLVAALAGGLWGSIAGFLKVRIGTNEVISTLLLSFIAVWALYGCVQSTNLLRQPMTNSATLPESLEIPDRTKVPSLIPDLDMPLHLGAIVCLVAAAVVALVLARSLFGLRLRAVGLNPPAARRAGMPIGATVMLAMFIAGAFAGLAGGFMLQGEQLALKARFPSGYGLDGLVVGLLARGTAKGVLASALLFGFLRSGGIAMELVAGVPSAIVLVIQGLVILLLAGSAWWLERRRTD